MAEYDFFANGMQTGQALQAALEKKVRRWQDERRAEKLDIAVFVVCGAADGSGYWNMHWDSETFAKLGQIKKGVAVKTLELAIGDVLDNSEYANRCKNRVKFDIYIGQKREQMERLLAAGHIDKVMFAGVPSEPKYRLNQLVVDKQTACEINSIIALLENMNLIYNEWGFSEVDPNPRSVVNLWGPPGTGKTMAVHAIAHKMGKKILVVNYAEIESKYVGDAPKNLIAAFDKAFAEDAIIFFDEADSFLGRRITNVDNGSEQAINSLRSQMLMKLEEFRGIVFFATNLHENYDKAFESRILKHIEFHLPDLESRCRIIESMLPKNDKAPYCANLYDKESGMFNKNVLYELAELTEGLSGREIRNCILFALVESAAEGRISAETIKHVFRKKQNEKKALTAQTHNEKKNLENEIKQKLDNSDYREVSLCDSNNNKK